MFVETERHTNCTVIVLEDDVTGKVEVLWYRNDKPPKLIMTDLGEEE